MVQLGAAGVLQAVLLITTTILLRESSAGYDEYEDISDWGYSEENGPCTWKNKYPCCKGHRQSPLSIHRKGSQTVCGPLLQWKCWDAIPCTVTLINNGRTVMARGAWDCKDAPIVKLGNCTYEFENVHFHWGSTNDTGSEHAIEGERFPLEMQVVHTKKPRALKRSETTPFPYLKKGFIRPERKTDDHELLIIVYLIKICNADPNESIPKKKPAPCPCLTRSERSQKRQYYETEDDPDQLKGNSRVDHEEQNHDSENPNNEDGERGMNNDKSTLNTDDNDYSIQEEGKHLRKVKMMKSSEKRKPTTDDGKRFNNENEYVISQNHNSLTKATGKHLHKKKPTVNVSHNGNFTQDSHEQENKEEPSAIISESDKQNIREEEGSIKKSKFAENTKHLDLKSGKHFNKETSEIGIDNQNSIHLDEKYLNKDSYLLSSENSKEANSVEENDVHKEDSSKNSDDDSQLEPDSGKHFHKKNPVPTVDDKSTFSNDDNELQMESPERTGSTLEDEQKNSPPEKQQSDVSAKGEDGGKRICPDNDDEEVTERNYNPKQKQLCLADLWREFSKVKNAGSTVNITPFPMSKIIPEFTREFYLYKGSITSPPCIENALYVVSNKILCVDFNQLEQFRGLMGDNCPLMDNYRPTQKRCKRPINYITLKRPKPTCTAAPDEYSSTPATETTKEGTCQRKRERSRG